MISPNLDLRLDSRTSRTSLHIYEIPFSLSKSCPRTLSNKLAEGTDRWHCKGAAEGSSGSAEVVDEPEGMDRRCRERVGRSFGGGRIMGGNSAWECPWANSWRGRGGGKGAGVGDPWYCCCSCWGGGCRVRERRKGVSAGCVCC